MAKPIFIIGIPFGIPMEEFKKQNEQISNTLKNDYHVLVYVCNVENPVFNVFYDKDIEEKKIEEVKEFIKEQINRK